jgi:hypothetical protein
MEKLSNKPYDGWILTNYSSLKDVLKDYFREGLIEIVQSTLNKKGITDDCNVKYYSSPNEFDKFEYLIITTFSGEEIEFRYDIFNDMVSF